MHLLSVNVSFSIIIFIISSDKAEQFITLPESTLKSIHQCQICGREHEENSTICFQCQEHKLIDREIENNKTLLSQQVCLLCYFINNSMKNFFFH